MEENNVISTEITTPAAVTQNRFKSPIFWAGVLCQVLAILVMTGLIGEELSTAIKTVIVSVFEVISAYSGANNPTSKKSF